MPNCWSLMIVEGSHEYSKRLFAQHFSLRVEARAMVADHLLESLDCSDLAKSALGFIGPKCVDSLLIDEGKVESDRRRVGYAAEKI
jgi:hypothetical protein